MLAQLHAENKLNLDAPIATYIPRLSIAQVMHSSICWHRLHIRLALLIDQSPIAHPDNQAASAPPITARHLLSHTSGIREFRHRQDLIDLVRQRLPFFNSAPKGPVTLEQYYCGSSSGGGGGGGGGTQPPPLPIVAVGTPGGQHIKVGVCVCLKIKIIAWLVVGDDRRRHFQ